MESKPKSVSGSRIWAILRDDWLVVPKALYFGINLVVYSVHAFSAKYFVEAWDLKLYEYGYVSSLMGSNFIGAILWSHIADKTGRHKSIISMCAFFYCLFLCMLMFKDYIVSHVAKVTYTAFFYGLANFFVAGAFPLLDNQVIGMLARDPRFSKEIFGRQRLWGTFGHCAATFLAAHSIVKGDDKLGTKTNYNGMFYLLIGVTIFFVSTVVFGIPNEVETPAHLKGGHGHHGHGGSEKKEGSSNEKAITVSPATENAGRPVRSRGPLFTLFSNSHFLFFMLVILVAGYVRSVMTYFQAYFVEVAMKQSKNDVALLGAVRVISEVGIFFFGRQLMGIFGVHWLLILSQVTGILRVFGYAIIPKGNSGLVVAVLLELLKGLNTGLVVSSAIRIANDIAPEGCGNTAQALFSGIYSGFSAIFAGIVGGLLIYVDYDAGEASALKFMFMVTAISSTIATVLFALKYAFVDRVMSCNCFGKKQNAAPAASK